MGILRISFFRPLIFFLYHTLCMLFFFFAVLHRLVLKVKRNLKLCMCQCDDYTRLVGHKQLTFIYSALEQSLHIQT